MMDVFELINKAYEFPKNEIDLLRQLIAKTKKVIETGQPESFQITNLFDRVDVNITKHPFEETK